MTENPAPEPDSPKTPRDIETEECLLASLRALGIPATAEQIAGMSHDQYDEAWSMTLARAASSLRPSPRRHEMTTIDEPPPYWGEIWIARQTRIRALVKTFLTAGEDLTDEKLWAFPGLFSPGYDAREVEAAIIGMMRDGSIEMVGHRYHIVRRPS